MHDKSASWLNSYFYPEKNACLPAFFNSPLPGVVKKPGMQSNCILFNLVYKPPETPNSVESIKPLGLK
jgi:hypothetical protein